jgi:hypothetical protein
MSRNGLGAVFAAMALTVAASPATAVTIASEMAYGSDATGSPGAVGFFSLSSITQVEETWAGSSADSDWDSSPPGVTLPGTRTDQWALVPEPGAWALALAGLGAVGASLRARRSFRPA